MTGKKEKSSGACACSQGIDRREFLKVAAVAGLLAGCSPIMESPTPTEEPTATLKPTLKPGQTEIPDLTAKKAVYILPKNVYALQCHASSVEVLKACGVSLTLAAPEIKEIGVWGGGTPSLAPDITLQEVKAADFDAVIFECGQPADTYDSECHRIAKETTEQGKVLAAICMMPALLAAAGVLNGKKATSNENDQYVLEQYGAVLADTDPVRDGKIVTASFNGAEQFGWLIAEALTE
jgi:putative intracellular protease/amidase